MDDLHAGQAGPGPRRPRLTVVVPVFNGAADLGRCLRSLRDTPDLDYELIVVDDGSTDDSAAVARSHGASVLRHDRTRGPAAARNTGALAATTGLVFFLDADVAVHPDTLGLALGRFDADPALSALFGSYDERPAHPGLVSRYRNLLHHYVHQRGAFVADGRPVRTFWTGCGAIRRDVFLGHGGFDPERYRRPAIEDIELGYRITRAGGSIVLARDVQATHLKRWSFASMVRTDILQRGVPWLLLMKRTRVEETDLNVDLSGRLSVAATGVAGIAGALTPLWPAAGAVAVACIAAVVALNLAFYRFLARTRGVVFAAACVPLHLVYFVCCGLSVLIALVLWHAGLKRAEPEPDSGAIRGLRVDEPATVPGPTPARTRRPARWRP